MRGRICIYAWLTLLPLASKAPPPTRRLGSSRPPPPSRVTPYLSLAQTRQVTLIVDQAVQTRIPAGLPSRLPNGGKPLQLSSLRVSFAVRTAAVDHLLPFFDPIACVFEVASSFEPLSHFKFAGTTGWSQLETLVLDDVSTLSAMQPYGRFDRSNPRRNLQGVQAIFRYSDFIASRTIVEHFSAELNDGVLLPALNADAATLQVASEAIKRSVRREMLSLEERDVFSGLGRWRIQVDETLARCLGETLGRPKSGEK